MDRYRELSSFSRDTVRSLVPLRLLNLVSLGFSIIILILSILFHFDLSGTPPAYTFSVEDETTELPPEPSICRTCSEWNIFLTCGITVSFLQIFTAFTSLSWKWAQNKTNAWCAVHSVVFVVFAPVFVFACTNIRQPYEDGVLDFLSYSKQKGFAGLVGLDMGFSIVAVIFVSIFYGLEIQSNYTRLYTT